MPQYGRHILWLLIVAAGCAPIEWRTTGRSPLGPARMSPDSVVLELSWLRSTESEAIASEEMWSEIDEQTLDPELRRRLTENGFRIGVAGPQFPAALAKMMGSPEAEGPAQLEQQLRDDALGPKHRRKHFRTGQRNEVVASEPQETFNLLLREDGALRGRTFSKGQGLFAVKTFPRGDGRVRIEITPELHYGEARNQWQGTGDTLLLQPGRRREILEQFRLDAMLSPGQMLVIACRPEMSGSAGHRFFSEALGGNPQIKTLVLRLAQTQHDDLFGESPEEVSP